MRPIGFRKSSNVWYLKDYGGMIYFYGSNGTSIRWWNISSGYFTPEKNIIQLKRKTIEESTSDQS